MLKKMENLNDLKLLLSFVPSFKEKSVLQIGSDSVYTQLFTQESSERANKVIVVDSDESLLQKNKEANNANNLEFIKSEFKSLNISGQKFDLIILCSLFKNLNDEEILDIIDVAIKHLNVSGSLLFREAFFTLTNDAKQHRSPIQLIDLIQSKVLEENGLQYGFDLIFAKPNKSFSSDALNANKVSFLFSKAKLESHHGFKSLKEFMDHKQYSRTGVLRYEKIFGAGFVSTGGIDTTTKFFQEYDLNLKKSQKVLDVGCGIGGGDFFIAEKFGAEVLGLDLASNMVGIAWDRAQNYKNLSTHFEIGDITKQKFPENYFDCIYSRDTILHIPDKESLFAQFKKWLKPGGKVFITDYCCGKKPWSDEFTAYVASRGYDLRTVPEYGDIFKNLGFSKVVAEDKTDLFVESLKMELKRMADIKEEFVKEFTLEDFDYLVEGWEAKLVRCAAGHQRWGLFFCEK